MTSIQPPLALDQLKGRLSDLLGEDVQAADVLLTTSFSKEDQILTWAVMEVMPEVDVVSLDTGCLFPATLETWRRTEAHFGRVIRKLEPDREEARAHVDGGGLTGIYLDLGARKRCCGLRKIDPLRSACAGKRWWVTGLRSDQSGNRSGMAMVEESEEWGLTKVHPLLDWSDEMVEAAVRATGVPVNPLHALGYLSIGCAPCTRPVLPGEDPRSGRWWWEQSSKECGLHRG